MKVLSLDPSFNSIGYVIVVDGVLTSRGCLHPPKPSGDTGKMEDDFMRAATIARELNELVLSENPDVACLEIPGGSQSSRAARMLGMATGILAAVVSSAKDCVYLISPQSVKRFVGKSDKIDIIAWALTRQPKLLDGIQKKSDYEHIADAYAVYEVWRSKVQQTVRGTQCQ